MPKRFSLKLTDEGTLDPSCIQEAGARWVLHWLRARFSANDPYLPLDHRVDEDPESLIVGILTDVGLAHPASVLITRALSQLLSEAEAATPDLVPFLSPLLRVCQRVHLPSLGSWFLAQLEAIALAHDAFEQRWTGVSQVNELLYAAIVQIPAQTVPAARPHWRALLGIPRYATQALLGLGRSFVDQIEFLPSWWDSVIVGERDRELAQLVKAAIRTVGQNRVIQSLQDNALLIPVDLQQAIDAILSAERVDPAFSGQRQHGRTAGGFTAAICNAALRRDLVLAGAH